MNVRIPDADGTHRLGGSGDTSPASELGPSPKLPAWLQQIRDLLALDPFTFAERRRAGETVTLTAPSFDPHLFPSVTLELGEDIPARAPLEIRDDGRIYAVEGHETREHLQSELGALHLDAPAFREHFGIAPAQMIDHGRAEVPDHPPTDPLADPSSSALQEVAEAIADSTPSYVYVASSWRNPHQPGTVEAIRALGVAAYDFRNPEGGTGFAWSEIDPAWQDWTAEEYRAALDHPRAIEGFASDFDAMQRADIVVLILPCGRSAHLELGWAVGAGKRTAILTRDGEEPELMAKMVDLIATSEAELLDWIAEVAR